MSSTSVAVSLLNPGTECQEILWMAQMMHQISMMVQETTRLQDIWLHGQNEYYV
jgi:hypothetical protein